MRENERQSSKDPLVELAYETIDDYVRLGQVHSLQELPDDLPSRAGCFVSIHAISNGDLRGCIGTIEPVRESLASEIIYNAIAAATQDPRFPAIEAKELDNLSIKVDVLFPPEKTQLSDLDPKRFGVIVSQGYKRGLLLPDLEGVDTVDDQVRIACMKAGIDPQSAFDLQRFEVVRHT